MHHSIMARFAAAVVTLCLTVAAVAQTKQDRIGSEYLPADAVATVVLSISDTMATPAVEMYPTEVADAWCKQNFGVEARDIDQIKLVVAVPEPAGPLFGLLLAS